MLLAAGCGHVTSVQHPATSGSLTKATVARNDFFAENRLNLTRGVLRDDVSLVRFDARSVCFDAVLRGLNDERDDVTVVASSRIVLEHDDGELDASSVTPHEISSDVAEGWENYTQATGRYETVCTENDYETDACIRWEEQEIMETIQRPTHHVVLSGGALICFDHDGALTSRTSELELEVGGGTFEFDLEGATDEVMPWPTDANGQPRVIVARGYEFLADDGTAQPTAGGEATPEPAHGALAEAAFEPPSRLREIRVRPLRLTLADGTVVAVDGRGRVRKDGEVMGSRFDGGLMYTPEGDVGMAVSRAGDVFVYDRRNNEVLTLGVLSRNGRRLVGDDGRTFWIDRSGRPMRQMQGRRPQRARARFAQGRRAQRAEWAVLIVAMSESAFEWR